MATAMSILIPTAAGSPWVDDFSVACSIDHLGETKGYKDYGNNSYGKIRSSNDNYGFVSYACLVRSDGDVDSYDGVDYSYGSLS